MDYCLKRLMVTLEVIYQVSTLLFDKILKQLISQALLETPIILQIHQSVFVQTVLAMIPIVIELQAILFREKLEPIPSMDKAMILGGFS